MLLEKILQIVKSPIFLVGLSVVSVVVIYVVVTRSPKTVTVTLGPKCPSGFGITCPDGTTQCAQNCPVGQQWDCGSKKCICSGNNKLCDKNTQCCDPCDNDMCCSSSNQITVNGVNSCCPPGTLPSKLNASSTTNDICLAACGNTTCGEGEACIKVTNLIPSTYDKFVTQPNVNGSYKDPTNASNNWITFCSNPDACSFGDENSLPNSIGNNNPYYNFDTYTQPGNKFGLCINSTATSNDTSCYGITDQTDCGNNPSCKWAVLPDDYDSNGPVGTQVQNYMNYKNDGVKSGGYYCDPGGLSLGKLVQYQASSGNCTWQSCVSQILNQGTVDVDWNDATQTCTAFKVPPYENIGYQPQQQKQCIGEGNPVKSCKSKNDFVNVIQCTAPNKPCGNCEQAGDYIYIGNGDTCQPVSDNNNWVFNECVPDSNSNAVRVLGPNGGNCPWGCSTVSGVGPGGGNCYNTDIPTGSGNIFGDNSIYPGSSGNVCLGNGQIVPQPKNPLYANSSFNCNVVQTCPVNTICENSLCACIFKPQELLVPNFIPNAGYEIATPAFAIYSIVNNQIYWLSTMGQVTCTRNSSNIWKMVSDHKSADLFSLSTAGFYNGIGIWWYGTQGYNNSCGGAVPLLINYFGDCNNIHEACYNDDNGGFCNNSQEDCLGLQQYNSYIAYFWDRTTNSTVSTGVIRSNKGYNISCDDTGSNVMIIDKQIYDENQVVVGKGDSVLFYVIPHSLLSSPNFSCTAIPS